MARNSDKEGARLKLDKKSFAVAIKAQPSLKRFERDWRFRNDDDAMLMPVRALDLTALEALLAAAQEQGTNRWLIGQLSAHTAVMKSPDKTAVKDLRALETAIRQWVIKDAIRGWVFKLEDDGTREAWLVYEVKYNEPTQYSVASTNITLARWDPSANDKGGGARKTKFVSFRPDDLKDKPTVSELLTGEGLFRENKMMLSLYDKAEARWLEWRRMLGEQFIGNGYFTASDDDGEGYLERRRFNQDMQSVKLVVDDDAKPVENRTRSELLHEIEEAGEPPEDERFTQLPAGLYVNCYNLSNYHGGWVHIDHMKPYEYQPELRTKLVLPPEHSDLIDALAADMDVLQEDIVLGKSGGTSILCAGPPGVGKTLTAEVFAEVIKRPLYRVHSGQLGTDAESVEEALGEALKNAERWRAVMLIDEADVFVRRRGADLQMNAVVGVFLRTLEYYKGLLFLTTNLPDDIDDAILSRCIAHVRYKKPDANERKQLWKTLGVVYACDFTQDEKQAQALTKRFPEATGRDIKGLIRLVMKYAHQRGKAIDFSDFERLSAFKGM